jgi:hypothetical protein
MLYTLQALCAAAAAAGLTTKHGSQFSYLN